MLMLLNNSLWYEAKLNISSQSLNRLTDFRCIFRNLQRSSETVNAKMSTMQLYSKYVLISNEFSVTYIKTSKHSRSICFSNAVMIHYLLYTAFSSWVQDLLLSTQVLWIHYCLVAAIPYFYISVYIHGREWDRGKKKKKKFSNLYVSHWRKFL